jgi:hypothetical protein
LDPAVSSDFEVERDQRNPISGPIPDLKLSSEAKLAYMLWCSRRYLDPNGFKSNTSSLAVFAKALLARASLPQINPIQRAQK